MTSAKYEKTGQRRTLQIHAKKLLEKREIIQKDDYLQRKGWSRCESTLEINATTGHAKTNTEDKQENKKVTIPLCTECIGIV